MTETYADERLDLSGYEPHTLALLLDTWQREKDAIDARIAQVRGEIIARLRHAGATAIPDDEFVIELHESSGGLDPSVLAPLKETLPSDDLAKVWTPAHTKTVEVGESWDGRRLRPMAHRYGGDTLRLYEEARLPGTQRLVVKRKEQR